jgi:hypothetical protein
MKHKNMTATYETVVSLDEIVGKNLEEWLDFITELVGAPLLMDVSYGIKELVPGEDGYNIRIWVQGDPSMQDEDEEY